MVAWHEIETFIEEDIITHTTYSVIQDNIETIRKRMCTEMVDLKEQSTRNALIKLGWTPPEEVR